MPGNNAQQNTAYLFRSASSEVANQSAVILWRAQQMAVSGRRRVRCPSHADAGNVV